MDNKNFFSVFVYHNLWWKHYPTSGYFHCYSQKRGEFLRSIISPDSKYPDSLPHSYLSGFVSNPNTFYARFVTLLKTATLNPKKKSPDFLRIRRNLVLRKRSQYCILRDEQLYGTIVSCKLFLRNMRDEGFFCYLTPKECLVSSFDVTRVR